jgi:exodeoxyribonuclease VII large subunit
MGFGGISAPLFQINYLSGKPDFLRHQNTLHFGMPSKIKLSELAEHIERTIQSRFDGETFWVTTQIMDVRKQAGARRCYLKLIEKENGQITAEMKAVFWSYYYRQIEDFEKFTTQTFADGLEITCNVRVRFHAKYGLCLDVLQIDFAYAIGSLEIERQKTLDRLETENPLSIRLVDGIYKTLNNTLMLPLVIQRIALVTAPESDGQRDFRQEIEKNRHGYAFSVKDFLAPMQGDTAHQLIAYQLEEIEKKKHLYDVVAIVRGGGSQTDFKPFEDYHLAKRVAEFPIPVITGIGHDRNTSIVDRMARQQKTPTKAASMLVEHNFEFENRLLALRDRFFDGIESLIENAQTDLKEMARLVKLASPQSIIAKGFAIITMNHRIIVNPAEIEPNARIDTFLKHEIIHSTVNHKTIHE